MQLSPGRKVFARTPGDPYSMHNFATSSCLRKDSGRLKIVDRAVYGGESATAAHSIGPRLLPLELCFPSLTELPENTSRNSDIPIGWFSLVDRTFSRVFAQNRREITLRRVDLRERDLRATETHVRPVYSEHDEEWFLQLFSIALFFAIIIMRIRVENSRALRTLQSVVIDLLLLSL